jgi:transglutaminase-like putative cysteine protease
MTTPSRPWGRSLTSGSTAWLAQIRDLVASQPLPEPEDSISLRVLTQLLVIIGIISIDVAAADVADPLWISLWAVPASILGAVWSWYRRRHRNVPVKFCIAIAMLLALAAFFVRLISGNIDTRLVLAELLIQLQVFHSFDLPRRKDLGYSIIIGLILLGVSATLSQTLIFAPLLLAFFIIAIPTLILDYRSRLGLVPQRMKRMVTDLSPRRLARVVGVVLALGLLVFALLPRLPGYQLRNFPVSSPIQFDGQFDTETIINPGYVSRGQGNGEGVGTGNSTEEGPGELDTTFYYGFNTRINQNLRGELEPQVVMRVRSQAPGFFRVMAFDRYTGQGWEVSRNEEEEMETIERPHWTMRFIMPWIDSVRNSQQVVQSYTIVSDLPNVLPMLHQPWQIYFPTRELAIDPEGTIRAPIPLSEGLTYTVISQVPYRDRTVLGEAPSSYPRSIRDYYLDVPADINPRLRDKTLEILATAPNPLANPYEKALYLAQYLKQNYSIQQDLPFFAEDEDLVEAFLFSYEGGYPDHFSTVLTMMLRSVGIPARLVVGFSSGDFNPFTGYYVVRNTNALAMAEVYFPGHGWFTFNPIPGFDVVPRSVEESQTFSALRQLWNWVAGWLPSPVAGFLNQIFEWIVLGMGAVIRFFTRLLTQGWVGLLLGVGLLTAISFLGWLLWSGWRSWRYRRWLGQLPPMENLYQQMLAWAAEHGLPKHPSQTPLEYAQQARQHQPASHADAISQISHAYVHWRYGRRSPDLDSLRQHLRTLQKPKRRRRFSLRV